MLSVRNLNAHYGATHALRGVSLDVRAGEVVALIGANGAGKSTTLKVLSGLLKPSGGNVTLRGQEATGRPPSWWVRQGVTHCPEARQLFPKMTVRENLLLGAYLRPRREIATSYASVLTLLPRLAERENQVAGTLSGGEQQMVALGRAMMASPKLLMLDEPCLGLAPLITESIFATVREIADAGTAVLLVEQNAHMALQTASRGYVMETGGIVAEGPSDELISSAEVRRAYLGL